MDSKTISREIRQTIRPLLKEAGFDRFTTRVAWRHGEDAIDVFDIRAVGSYHAGVFGITPFSFSVDLGRFLRYVPPTWPPKVKDGVQIPSEPECHFRGSILPKVSPAPGHQIYWPVDATGRNLRGCIHDVADQLPTALEWFARLDDRAEVLRILQDEPMCMPELWGFGNNPSPIRAYLSGYVALASGHQPMARRELQQAVDSQCFVNLFSSVEGALLRAV